MASRTLVPFDPAVVAPWRVGSGRRGVVLIHGFSGTPPELRGMGDYLKNEGWNCIGPLLAGHGTTPEDLETTRWRDWAGSVTQAIDRLSETCDEIMVVGQSMGGTLALHAAATDQRVKAVAILAAPIRIYGQKMWAVPLAKHIKQWHFPDATVDLHDKEAVNQLFSYGKRPLKAIDELRRLMRVTTAELPKITQPVLIIHGGHNKSVHPRNARDIERRLTNSAAKRVVRYPLSGHAVSVDINHVAAYGEVAAWFDGASKQVTGSPPSAALG